MNEFPFCIPTEHYTAEDINEFFKWCVDNLGANLYEKAAGEEFPLGMYNAYDKECWEYFGINTYGDTLFTLSEAGFSVVFAEEETTIFKSIKLAKKHLGGLK